MLNALFFLALAIGALSAYLGNRTAWPLLASAAFSTAISYSGVPFNPVIWTLIDIAAIIGIVIMVHRNITYMDAVILALFLPAWICYHLGQDMRFWGPFIIVIAQFVLTLPLLKLLSMAGKLLGIGRDRIDTMDMRVFSPPKEEWAYACPKREIIPLREQAGYVPATYSFSEEACHRPAK